MSKVVETKKVVAETTYSTLYSIMFSDGTTSYILKGFGKSKTAWGAGAIQRKAGVRFWITDSNGNMKFKLEGLNEFRTMASALEKLVK